MKYILELEDEPNKDYFGEGNYYRCKQIPYWSISESMRNRLEPYDEAVRKTESSSEKPNNCEDLQDWKDRMWAEAVVTEPQTDMAEDIVESFGFKAESYRQAKAKDEPQTCSFSDCDNFKNPDYERCIECKRKQIKLKTEQTERSE